MALSNQERKVILEQWKDKDGKVRETHFYAEPGQDTERWIFSKDGKPLETFWLMSANGRHDWYLKRSRDNTESALGPKWNALELIEQVAKQFAAHGTIPEHILEAETQVEQPKLPPNEVFSCRRIDLATATDNIDKKIAHIQERKKLMSDAFYYQGAVQTLQAAFKAKGVTSSMSSADTWGKNGIGSAWSELGEGFYKNNVEALNQLLEAVKKQGFATEGQMKNLDQAMTRWEEVDGTLEAKFRALVDSYTAEAKVYDEMADYMSKYYQQLAQLQSQNPYPGDAVNALTNKMYVDSAAFDKRIKNMEDVDQQQIRDGIKSLASDQVFKFLAETPDCKPGKKEQPK